MHACIGVLTHTYKNVQPCQKIRDEDDFRRNPVSMFMQRFGVLFEEFNGNGW
jgi:hypothetical protein